MKKLQYVLYTIMLIIIIGLVAYDYYPDKTLDQNTITRASLLVVATFLSIIRTATRSNRDIVNKKAAYSKAYPEFIRNAFSHSPKLEKVFYNAIDDYNQDRSASGIKKLEKLRPQCQNTDDIYAVTIFLALCYTKLLLYRDAIELYQTAMHLHPISTLASNMGVCYSELGMTDEAIGCYYQAIQLDPKNKYPYNNLAQLYINEGKYEKVADYAKQALSINPKMPQALSAMTIASYMLGDMEAYENYYRQAVSNSCDGDALKDYIRSLDSTI